MIDSQKVVLLGCFAVVVLVALAIWAAVNEANNPYRKGYLGGTVKAVAAPIVTVKDGLPTAYSLVVGDASRKTNETTVCVKNPVLFPSVIALKVGDVIEASVRMHKETKEIEILILSVQGHIKVPE